jgi:hypothetical protein
VGESQACLWRVACERGGEGGKWVRARRVCGGWRVKEAAEVLRLTMAGAFTWRNLIFVGPCAGGFARQTSKVHPHTSD